MFMELHYHTDREFRRLDLAEKMAERRRQSLAATRRASFRTRMLLAPAVTAQKHEAWRVAGESSQASGRP